MPNRTLTIRGVADRVLSALRARSAASRRSLNAEVLRILDKAVGEARGTTRVGVREAEAPADAGRSPGARPTLVDRGALAAACRRHHITRLTLFGSFADGTAGLDSDVDVVVDFEPGMTPGLGIEAVAEALRPAFGGRRVDLVTSRGLSRRFRDHIAPTAVILHGA